MLDPDVAWLQNELADPQALPRPLCIDLDGTLVRTDTLWESVLLLLRRKAWLLFVLPFWLIGGRARFKRSVAERLVLDPATLPYRTDLLEALQYASGQQRPLVLATAANRAVADAVALHLGIFSEVVASSGEENLKGSAKRDLLLSRFGKQGFDYVGDSAADLTVFEVACRGYLVNCSAEVARQAESLGGKVKVLSLRPSRIGALAKALRPHQWAKNSLVIVPVLLASGLPSWTHCWAAAMAVASFNFCASAGYVYNDLIDVEADRAHRSKHKRPFASGTLPIAYGPPLFAGLLLVSFGLALATLPLGFVGLLGMYFVATLAYSFQFKSKLMLDVVVLAWLYTHRILAGGVATKIPISAWLLAFSMFMFLSLAFAKRYVELRASAGKSLQLKSRGYHTQDLEMVASMGPAAGYIAVLVFSLYVESTAGSAGYRTPAFLWFVCPVLLYWISRIWFLAHRGQMQDDPVKFALVDRTSWVCALIIALSAAAARFWIT